LYSGAQRRKFADVLRYRKTLAHAARYPASQSPHRESSMSEDIHGYDTPGCAYCPSTVRACRQGEGEERGPAFCPSKVDPDGVAAA